MKHSALKTAALVLSGGGSMGAAHVGALQVLEKYFLFDRIYGVSAGAIVGAALACGKSAEEISEFVTHQKFLGLIFDRSPRKLALIKGEKILKWLDDWYEERSFEDLALQLRIGATDFSTGKQVFLGSGNIAAAVRASIAVPLLFEPYFHQEKWLIDGGFSQNFPLDTALREYSDGVVGVDVCSFFDNGQDLLQGKFGKMKTMRQLAERSLRILFKNQQQNFPKDSRAIYIRPDLSGFSTWDIKRLKAIERKGFEAATEILAQQGFE